MPIKRYPSFVASLDSEGADHTLCTDSLLIHKTHGALFAASVDEASGLLLCAMQDRLAYDGFDVYLDDTLIPGATAPEKESPKTPHAVSSTHAQVGNCQILSALVERNGVVSRTTVFTFDGGIAILGCGIGYTEEPERQDVDSPIFRTCIARCFADKEKMKTHNNTVTHGGLIYRNLIDEVKMVKHIRPTAAQFGDEKRNMFTLYLETTPEIPCFACEITTVGMGFGCQILSNHEGCQAIMIGEGEIISFNPTDGSAFAF